MVDDIDDRTPYQDGHEGTLVKFQQLMLSKAVKGSLLMDRALNAKKDQVKPSASFPPFLKKINMKAYLTGDGPDTKITQNTTNAPKGILDRVKYLSNSKVSFSINELEVLFKSVFRQLEFWSFTTSGLDILADGFEYLLDKLPEKDRPIAEKYSSYIKCLDKAGRHGIGEAAHAFTNLLLRKREHFLSFSARNIDSCQKADFLYSPISNFKLFDSSVVKEQVKEIRQSTESAAIANIAMPRPRFFPDYNPSPLPSFPRGRGRIMQGFKSSKPSAQNEFYWKRRDRYVKNARKFQ